MTVLFDLDGTLLDTAADFVYAINQLLEELGQNPITVEELKPAVSHGLAEIMQVCFKISPDHAQYPLLAQKLISLYEKSICLYTQPFPGILNLLTALENRQIRWGIVTNRPSHFTERLLHSMDLKERAACIVSGDTTPYSKPHPGSLLFACQQIAVEPQHCIYIGDAERDIQAGKAAGMATLGVLFGYVPDIPTALQWGADYYVHHADEILPKVLEWQAG